MTVCFDESLYRALRRKSAETAAGVSELVNTAIRLSLKEDADDLAAFCDRANERRVSFESVVRDLKKSGKR